MRSGRTYRWEEGLRLLAAIRDDIAAGGQALLVALRRDTRVISREAARVVRRNRASWARRYHQILAEMRTWNGRRQTLLLAARRDLLAVRRGQASLVAGLRDLLRRGFQLLARVRGNRIVAYRHPQRPAASQSPISRAWRYCQISANQEEWLWGWVAALGLFALLVLTFDQAAPLVAGPPFGGPRLLPTVAAAQLPPAPTPLPATATPTPTPAPPFPLPTPTWDRQAALLDGGGCRVTRPPVGLGLSPFYEKYCAAGDVPIIASAAVPDAALPAAWAITMNMLAYRPDIRRELARHGARVAIIGMDEFTTDMPEYRHLYRLFPDVDWDSRARGLGGTPHIPLTSAGAENLLCLEGDRYQGEQILVHELAHGVKDMGLVFVDRYFAANLAHAYQQALATGRWADTYAITSVDEYWAEGVQAYFNANFEAIPGDGVHNHVNTRAELADYDPLLNALIAAVFPAYEWTPVCPAP